MKKIITMMIEDNNNPSTDVQAFSKNDSVIFITAKDTETALILLDKAQGKAEEACKNWEGEEQEQEPQEKQHYYTITRSIEEMDERAKAYEETPEGKRFVKTIENAKQFTFKHSKGSLRCIEADYLANKHYNSLLNGIFDVTALAYRSGYNKAVKDMKR